MSRPHARFRLRRLLARFKRERSGSAAIEFAVLALPFVALLFAITELGMIYMIDTSLSYATISEARKIRTCQLPPTTTAAQFKVDVCNDNALSWLGAVCSGNIQVDSETYQTFQKTNTASNPLATGAYVQPAFSVGNANAIILVRTYYPWTLVAPGLDGLVAQMSNGQFMIQAASTFRNEPCT